MPPTNLLQLDVTLSEFFVLPQFFSLPSSPKARLTRETGIGDGKNRMLETRPFSLCFLQFFLLLFVSRRGAKEGSQQGKNEMEGYGTGGDRGHPRRERQTSVMLSERRVHQVVMLTILSAPFVTCAYWDCASYECARHFFNAFREGGGSKHDS